MVKEKFLLKKNFDSKENRNSILILSGANWPLSYLSKQSKAISAINQESQFYFVKVCFNWDLSILWKWSWIIADACLSVGRPVD